MIDHDRLFKELLTTFFTEFCELFLPAVAADLDRDSLEFLDKEVFSDVTTGARYETDLLVKARWRGRESCFLIHVEHQASKQSDFNKRMFRYFARLHEKHDLPIYPVVLFSYDTPRKPEPSEFGMAFPDLAVLDFRYRVIQLNRLSWRDYVKHANPVAGALMAKMNIAPNERAKVKLECLRLLVTLKLDPARMQMISGFVDTYLELNRAEMQQFTSELAKEQPAQQEKVMQITGNWMREGWEKGLLEGRQEGRREGQAALVLQLVQHKWGALPQRTKRRIERLSPEALTELGIALLSFSSRADLESWLKKSTSK